MSNSPEDSVLWQTFKSDKWINWIETVDKTTMRLGSQKGKVVPIFRSRGEIYWVERNEWQDGPWSNWVFNKHRFTQTTILLLLVLLVFMAPFTTGPAGCEVTEVFPELYSKWCIPAGSFLFTASLSVQKDRHISQSRKSDNKLSIQKSHRMPFLCTLIEMLQPTPSKAAALVCRNYSMESKLSSFVKWIKC